MPAQRLEQLTNIVERTAAILQQAILGLAQAERIKRIRQVLLLVLLVWAVFALAQLLWALWPQPQSVALPSHILNPVARSQAPALTQTVDMEALKSWQLFGEAGEEASAAALMAAQNASPVAREGIEEGARETRLDLILRGIVASSDSGLGHAIIEYRNQQAVYAVDDELPVSSGVKLAKVMPGQVVIDNSGTYELLSLFEQNDFDRQLNASRGALAPAAANRPSPPSVQIEQRADTETTQLALAYRRQLYQDPQSLASLVRISAVREDGKLRGYRVAPGRDAAAFERFGFKAGDLVTSVNGIALDNPANTVQLYHAMREASEAVFELERQGQPLSLSVDLGAAAGEQ
ncbi:type II secretion system protein GspC [Parahaliea sp. F7430]|uniref:Type II secretion system protein GspC n=1 Tax=Sediminihaliea albiluteola TaxID=2758564 RepID=A0A7W2TVY5_9GAMM|nr:type II secretion system protein GspC [Sediminihaliea albiluteola]MBA6412916.1 type II secretion system protein GspC [Sediminihaliea albiluteola]